MGDIPPPRRFGRIDPAEAARLSGRELLEAMLAGRLPGPTMAERMHFGLVEVGDGIAIFEGVPGADLLNPQGTVHGGWALAMIDSAAGCAFHTTLPPGVGYTTVETKANFSRAIRPDGRTVRAEGRVVTAGRTIGSAEVRMIDGDGRIVAHGTSTLMVLGERG